MKNKKKIILILLLLLIIITIGVILYKYYTKPTNNYKQSEYTFDTNYGTIKIEADKALKARGTAGASNNIFYLKDNNLYLYSENGVNELYAKNIDDIYYAEEQGDQITVVTNKDTVIIKESSYLKYLEISQDKEQLSEFNFNIAHGPVTIKADKAIQAKTEAGATEYIFYLKNNNLYHYVIEGEDELYATNVTDILYANSTDKKITVVIDETSNIIIESEYLLYVTTALKQFTFETSEGKINIYADKALSARGTVGASNYIFYLIKGNLYLYSANNINELYAKNVGNIYYAEEQGDQITVTTTKNTEIIKESPYLNYKSTIQENTDNLKEYTFSTAYGIVTIKADYALAAQGSAGASNNIFYIKNNNLYYYIHEGEDELYAEEIKEILYESKQAEQITVVTTDSTKIIKESPYLKYKSNNSKFTFSTAYGTVEIEATYALTCRGYAGATNNIFYIKNNNLYYYVHEGEDELYASNVDKMYYETKQSETITISTNQHTNIIKRHSCLQYN